MQSLKELYKIGPGPSSSHTLAPYRACKLFIEQHPNIKKVVVELYGSLSLTGKGHYTDQIIIDVFKANNIECNVKFCLEWNENFPNGFYIYGGENIKWTVFSLGGGSISIKEYAVNYNDDLYIENNFEQVKSYCLNNECDLYEYVTKYEDDIDTYLGTVLNAMLAAVERGLNTVGLLPGKLKVERSAKALYLKARNIDDVTEKNKLLLMSYAYAASEENAARGQVVTSPTLGASGVLAAIMYHYYYDLHFSKHELIKALAVGGVFGNIIKQNATISGAVGGCQAEIGVACVMGAAACAYLADLSIKQIEYAAEIAMEHHLGLTCDPVGGYVIIPCIERNAVASLRALDAYFLSKYMGKIKDNRISFDMVVNTMSYTGKKIPIELKETSLGGLAIEIKVD